MANVVMSLSTLRNRIRVVSCQFLRLRLLPTAQAMKAPLDTGGRKTTEVRAVQSANACFPTSIKACGSVRELSPVQPSNALIPTLLTELGSVRELSSVHDLNALNPT